MDKGSRRMDRPGSLVKMLSIIAEAGANILAVEHDRLKTDITPNQTTVHIVCEVGGKAHGEALTATLQKHGYTVE